MKLQYEVCLVRIKEKVGEKRSTIYIHRYANCLLKITSNKQNKYVFNQFQRTFWQNQCFLFFLQNKICPFQKRQCICICIVPFFRKHSWTNSINLSFSIEWWIVVYRKCFNDIAGGEEPCCVHSTKVYIVLQNPHLIHTTPWVDSVTVPRLIEFFTSDSHQPLSR